jgi:hypothetical protein
MIQQLLKRMELSVAVEKLNISISDDCNKTVVRKYRTLSN